MNLISPKIVAGKITKNPNNTPGIRIGDKTKTSPNAIGVLYDIIQEQVIHELKYSAKKEYQVTLDKSEISKIKKDSSYAYSFKRLLDNFASDNNHENFPITINEKPHAQEFSDLSRKLQLKPYPFIIDQITTNPMYNSKNKKFNIQVSVSRTDPTYYKAMGNQKGLD